MRKLNFGKFGISDEQLERIKLVLAFDLGHGESMVSYLWINGNEKPQIAKLDNNDSDKLITGLFKMNRNSETWKISRLGPTVSSFNEVHIGFKSTPEALNKGETEPGTGRAKKELLQAYVGEVLKAVKLYNEDIEIEEDSTLVFVGCPSSRLWKDQETAYAEIIKKESPFPVVIMPESRAALFKAVFDNKLFDDLDVLEKGIIVFDFGSSTADWTYMLKNLSQGKMDIDEDSINLGGSMVEAQMMERGIVLLSELAEEEKRQKVKGIVDAMKQIPALESLPDEELWAQAEASYVEKEENWEPKDEQRALLDLRIMKENYFSVDGALKQEYTYQTADNQVKRFEINREFMEAEGSGAIHQKFTYATKDGIWEKSWYDACRQLFLEVKRRMEDKSREYSSIVLTGGASRMKFVQKLCGEVFGDGIKIVVDPNPSTCVARGMAYAGAMDIKARLALPDVLEKVMGKLGLPNVLERVMFIWECAQGASDELKGVLYDEVVWPGLLQWKDLDGLVSPRKLCEECRATLESLQKQENFQGTVRKAIQKGILDKRDEIINIINETYKEIYQRKIPENYQISLDDEQLKNIAGGVVQFTFREDFEKIINGALSFWGTKEGWINTIDKQMDKAERTMRVDRIVSENRRSQIEGFCKDYIWYLLNGLFQAKSTRENLQNCVREAIEIMLDDLSAYFA